MRRASSARGSANSLGSAGKAESWPAHHGGYPSDRKRSFGHRVKKTASAPFVFLKKSFSGRSHRSARKRAPTPTRDLSADFERESEGDDALTVWVAIEEDGTVREVPFRYRRVD